MAERVSPSNLLIKCCSFRAVLLLQTSPISTFRVQLVMIFFRLERKLICPILLNIAHFEFELTGTSLSKFSAQHGVCFDAIFYYGGHRIDCFGACFIHFDRVVAQRKPRPWRVCLKRPLQILLQLRGKQGWYDVVQANNSKFPLTETVASHETFSRKLS